MHKERKLYILKKALKNQGKKLNSNEYAFFCPKHGSRPGRMFGQLGVNIVSDKFHCWSCNFSGKNLIPLLERGTSEFKEYVESISIEKPKEEKEKQYEQPRLPREFRTLSRDWKTPYYSAAISYLKHRQIERDDIIFWKLGYCEEGEYRNRIIIPSFDDSGYLNFFTGRAFYEGTTRYKNGNFCKDIIFNDYLVDWRKPVTITEGPFDAFKIRDNAIALQGSIFNTSTKLFTKIVLSGVSVYFAMDEDAYDKQLEIIKELVFYGVECNYVNLNGKKDVGEMSKQEFAIAKESSINIKSDVDLLKLRIYS